MRRYESAISNNARWESFDFRPGDIIISTPPKAGTTLLQMLTALVVFDSADLPATLDEISPWYDLNALDQGEVDAALAAQTHRRFIKTHTPLDGLPDRDDVTFLTSARDPRDIFVSWKHHMANIDRAFVGGEIDRLIGLDNVAHLMAEPESEDDSERFGQFLEQPVSPLNSSLATFADHMRIQWDRRHDANVCALHYLDTSADPAAAMVRIAATLGLDRDADRLRELSGAASIDSMRASAADRAPTTAFFVDPAKFFRTGGRGEWEAFVTDEQRARYDERVAELLAPDVAAWIHGGEGALA